VGPHDCSQIDQQSNFSRLVDGITGALWGCLRLTAKLFAEFIQVSPWLDREQMQIPLRPADRSWCGHEPDL
jgi:hypothetical protein